MNCRFFFLALLVFFLSVDMSHAVAKGRSLQTMDYIILLDVSGSMTGQGDGNGNNIFENVKEAINLFVDKEIPSGATVNFFTFGEKVFEKKEFIFDGLNSSKQDLHRYVTSLSTPGKATNIYGTLFQALEVAESKIKEPAVPLAIMIFTDGIENRHEKSLVATVEYFKKIKRQNPFLSIYYYHLTNKENPDLARLAAADFVVSKIDPTSKYFQEQLSKTISIAKKSTESSFVALNSQYLKSRQEKLAAIDAAKKAEVEKLAAIDAAKKADTKNLAAINATKKAETERLAAKKAADAAERQIKLLNESKKQQKELRALLASAKNLASKGTRQDLQDAKEKFETVLDVEPNRAEAIDGLKGVKQRLWELKPFYAKYWHYLALAAVAICVFLLFCRLLFSSFRTKQLSCRLLYVAEESIDDEPTEETLVFSQTLFRRKGISKTIGSSMGDIILNHSAVSPFRHAELFCRGNRLFLKKGQGQLFDCSGEVIDQLSIEPEETIFFQLTGELSSGESLKVVLSLT